MKNSVNSVIKEAIKKVKPSENEFKEIENSVHEFVIYLNNRVKKLKINADVFVGGSFAKKTMIKKKVYDVDIFLRFDSEYNDNKLSDLAERILKGIKKERIHGSRDYFKIDLSRGFFIEIVPVRKIKNLRGAKNITDLSYSHVKYVNKKIKSEKILNEILLAKAFCYASGRYGAESYIKGFSGYGIELLVYYYGSFLKFVKEISKLKEKKVIDLEKDFKNKREILMNLNSSKLGSPIILIDPTYKTRNVLAALSHETFEKFREHCKDFLKNPGIKFFENRKSELEDIENLREDAKKKKLDFAVIRIGTSKQAGDIAGSKLLKFYNYFAKEAEKFFEIKKSGFDYDEKNSAEFFLSAKRKKEIVFQGPRINDEKNVRKFRKKHKKTFVKSGRIFAKDNLNLSLEKFVKSWAKKNKKRMKEMSVKSLKVF